MKINFNVETRLLETDRVYYERKLEELATLRTFLQNAYGNEPTTIPKE